MSKNVPIAVAYGDGIGPEITRATLDILKAANARIDPIEINIGKQAFDAGIKTGIADDAWQTLRDTKVLLKGPITTPQGGGYKSINVTLRKSFGMFANVRPVKTFEPFVKTKHAGVDMIIFRENEEDLYSGMEYRQTLDTCHSIKFMSRTGSEMIIRYAFEYARTHGRKKVTCLIKDNIMKISDGLFHKSFKLVGEQYPEIEKESLIVDIGMARVADTPEHFDVVVTPNLYGDIVSDIASQISGSIGLAGSFNLGHGCAMFEAVHGTAPDIAGKGIANPSSILNAAILMLEHIGQSDIAGIIQNAWLRTIEDGSHTGDIAKDKSKALSTQEFAQAVIANLGNKPQQFKAAKEEGVPVVRLPNPNETNTTLRTKRLTGVDVIVDWQGREPQEIGTLVEKAATSQLKLSAIASRGMKVYPGKVEAPVITDNWHCRFMGEEGAITQDDILELLKSFNILGLQWGKVEGLFTFDNEPGFAQIQGE